LPVRQERTFLVLEEELVGEEQEEESNEEEEGGNEDSKHGSADFAGRTGRLLFHTETELVDALS
jgi:hypothetical protein